MTDEYTPERIAAARAMIAAMNNRHDAWSNTRDEEDIAFSYMARDPENGWGAALDALEAAQAEVRELSAKMDWESEFNATLIRDNAHIGQREAEYAKRADAAEAEVARLTAENTSLLRRIEGLRLAVWGDKGQPKVVEP